MSKRRIRPRRDPGFHYTGPAIRRNRVRHQSVHQPGERPEEVEPIPTLNTPSRVDQPAQQPLNPSPIPSPTQDPAPSPPPPASPIRDTEQDQSVDLRELASHHPPSPSSLDDLLHQIYTHKESPAAYSAAIQNYIDKNYSLSIHKQRRKKFRLVFFV